jgi:nucleotide-binding universal stress UspA family protein
MSRTIVIALDNSDLSAHALPIAERVAQQWRGRLLLVHAVGRDAHAAVLLERKLEELVNQLTRVGIHANAVVRRAPPAQAIVDVARERGADLIVMASHQRHGVSRWLNGSVTEDVLTRTATPLLVVPWRSEPAPASGVRVLVPLDGTVIGAAALEFFRGAPTTRPLELLLLRAVSVNPVVIGVDPAYTVQPLSEQDIEMEVQDARKYLDGVLIAQDDPSVKVRRLVIEATESIPSVILGTALRERVDAIAVGTHAKAGVPRLVLGSVSEEILERSTVPVLLMRQRTGSAGGDPAMSGHAAAQAASGRDHSVGRRDFRSAYAASIRALSAATSRPSPGLTFTWRIRLPLPCNKPVGSFSSAPMKNPTFTCALKTLT